MRYLDIPALITDGIEDPDIIEITEPISASISGTTLIINGQDTNPESSRLIVSGEATITLTGDVTIDTISKNNIRHPSIHKISIKTNDSGNFTYVPNNDVIGSSVSTTTKTGSDLEILLITTPDGQSYIDLDITDYVSPAVSFTNTLTGFSVSELISTYGASAKLYKPDGTLLTTLSSARSGKEVPFGYVESTPQEEIVYKVEVKDELGRTSKYNLPRKWVQYVIGTDTTPGFEKFVIGSNEYTSSVTVPTLAPSSTARIHKTNNHGYLGINFKMQGRDSPSEDWSDIADADENNDILPFATNKLYQRVWVKPTAKVLTSVSSSNVVTITLTDLTEDITATFTGADPFEIDETSNIYTFQETAKIGLVDYTVHIGTETYTNAVSAKTEEISVPTTPNTDMTADGPNMKHTIATSSSGSYMCQASADGRYIAHNPTNNSVVQVLKGDPENGYTNYATFTYSQYSSAGFVGSMSYDGKYIIIAQSSTTSYTYEIWKNDESTSTFTKLSQSVSRIGSHNNTYKPSFVPRSGTYDFGITGTDNSTNFDIQLYKHNVGTDTWTAQTIINDPANRPTGNFYRGLFSCQFTRDGKYLMMGAYSTYGGYQMYTIDWDANTAVFSGANYNENNNIGHSGTVTLDGKYVLIFHNDSNSRKIFKNNDAGDWSSATDVTSTFTFENTDDDQGHDISFFGENSEYFVSKMSGGNVRVYKWLDVINKEIILTYNGKDMLTLTHKGGLITTSVKLYKDDILYHTFGASETSIVIDAAGVYQAIADDKYYSLKVTVTKVTETLARLYLNRFACFLIKKDGKVWYWGESNYGANAMGNNTQVALPTLNANLNALPSGIKQIGRCGTDAHASCAITNDGKLYTWGYNGHGQLGRGNTTDYTNQGPWLVSTQSSNTFTFCHSSYYNNYALQDNGYLWSCGNNGQYLLGNGNNSNQSIFVRINLANVIDMHANHNVALALTSDSKVYIWGTQANSCLSTFGTTGTPTHLSSLDGKNIVKVRTGGYTGHAISSDGKLYSWGKGAYYAVPDGTNSDVGIPTEMTWFSRKNIKLIDAQFPYDEAAACLALDDQGNMYVWGMSDHGAIGVYHHHPTTHSWPVLLKTNIASISVGRHSCGCIDKFGQVYTWGDGLAGQQNWIHGSNSDTDINYPTSNNLSVGSSVVYDGFDKYILSKDTTVTSNLTFGSNTVSLDTKSEVFIYEPHTYTFKIMESNKTTYTSTVISSTPTRPTGRVYPPKSGTHKSLSTSGTANVVNTWTIDGALYGNGAYKASMDKNTNSSEHIYHAFSGVTGYGHMHTNNLGSTAAVAIQLHMPQKIKLTKYAMYSRNFTGEYNYAPKTWKVYGSNDGTNWTELDSQIDQTVSAWGTQTDHRDTKREYTVSGNTKYFSSYKLDVTANGGGAHVVISQIEYYGDEDEGFVSDDGFGKLSVDVKGDKNASPTVTFHSNTYVMGAARDLYIKDIGAYSVDINGSSKHFLGTKTHTVSAIDTAVAFSIAFHHGTFADSDDPHSDGSITAAATAGHIYSDTAPGEYSWGTLTSCVKTAMANNIHSDENNGYNNGSPPIAGYTTYKWTPPAAVSNARTLVVAGGGGGGADMGGGGGAGGLLASTNANIALEEQTIVVGDGGARGYDPGNDNKHAGGNGANSSISGPGITSIGGGGGASGHNYNNRPAGNGGSGGGGSGGRNSDGNNGGERGTGTAGQGFDGARSGNHWYPAGGGGAGEKGYGRDGSGGTNVIPHGGNGREDDILGTNYWWAGGGGGSLFQSGGGTSGYGGKGGGGGGAPPNSAHNVAKGLGDTNGITNGEDGPNPIASWNTHRGGSGGKHTGGGGGGGDYNDGGPTEMRGGRGGSGIVIIKAGSSIPTLNFDGYNKLTIDNVSDSVKEWPPPSFTSPTFSTSTVTGVTTTNNGRDQTWTISGASYGNGEYSASYNNTVLSNANYHGPVRCFDKVNDGYAFHSLSIQTGIVTINMPEKILLDSYELRHRPNANTNENHAPRDWTLEASNDGTTWDVLDTQANQSYNPDVQGDEASKRTYTVSDNVTEYSRYRLNVTANDGGAHLVIGQWKLFEPQPTVTSIIKKDGLAFGTTTSKTIYIKDTGIYTAEVKDSDIYMTELSKEVGSITIPQSGSMSISTHIHSVFATDTSGNFWVWGRNDYGYLGLGHSTDNQIGQINSNMNIGTVILPLAHVSGYNSVYTLVCNTIGECWGWGQNNSTNMAALGNTGSQGVPFKHVMPNDASTNSPVLIIQCIAGAGSGKGIALGADSNVYTWGNGNYGQLGHGNTNSLTTPTRVTYFDTIEISEVGTGTGSSYALSSDGTLYAWGRNDNGALGIGNTTDSTNSTPISIATGVKLFDCHAGHVVYAKTNNTVFSFGWNHSYQLGNGNTTSTGSHYQLSVFDNVPIKQVVAHYSSSQVLTESGEYWVWGENNSNQQLGISGNSSTVTTPTKSTSASAFDIHSIGKAMHASYILTTGGDIYTHGGNGYYLTDQATNSGQTITWTKTQNVKNLLSAIDIKYDGKNKISLQGYNYADTSTLTDPNGTTYNIGTAKTVYIKDAGEYELTVNGADAFVKSNVYVSSLDLVGAPIKPIDFDGFNKLTLISPGANPSANVTLGDTKYELTTQRNMYIKDIGTYDLEMSGSNVFALSSNVVGVVTHPITTGLDIPAFPTNSAPTRTNIPYGAYPGGMYSLTYNGDAYEITVDSEEQGGSTYDPITSVWARGWHLFTKIITSEGSGGGTTTNYAQYNSANYVTVPAHVKIKLPSAKVAVGGFLRESRNNHITGFIIQGSNNDSDWTDLYTGTTIGITDGVTFTFSNSTAYQYYRLRVTSLSTPDANTYFRLDAMNIHFLGYFPGYDNSTPPSFTFDNFKKLTITDITPVSTTLTYGSNVYDIGTTTAIHIENTGKYDIVTRDASTFAISSVNVSAIDTPVSFRVAFHHGTFADSEDPHGDGSVTAAATAGHIYSDTAPGTYTWGTLTSCVKTAMANNNHSDEDFAYRNDNGNTPTAGYTTYKWTPPAAVSNARTLVVAGGGGGGTDMGGGGGAGGLLASTNTDIALEEQTIVVGDGGARGYGPAGGSTNQHAGGNGANSSISGPGITAIGGGGGATGHNDTYDRAAGNGGSGGGGSGGLAQDGNYGANSGTGIAGQGFDGGNSGVAWYPGGGGGAGEKGYGRNGSGGGGNTVKGDGGNGLEDDILGTSYWWAGGGGCNVYHSNYSPDNRAGHGGKGGGGGGAPHGSSHGVSHGYGDTNGITNGKDGDTATSTNAVHNGGSGGKHTGGGGGGGDHNDQTNVLLMRGGRGGSGIVIIKVGDITPSLTYDNTNKLTITDITPTSTTLTIPNGSSLDIGTSTDIYIKEEGPYRIETMYNTGSSVYTRLSDYTTTNTSKAQVSGNGTWPISSFMATHNVLNNGDKAYAKTDGGSGRDPAQLFDTIVSGWGEASHGTSGTHSPMSWGYEFTSGAKMIGKMILYQPPAPHYAGNVTIKYWDGLEMIPVSGQSPIGMTSGVALSSTEFTFDTVSSQFWQIDCYRHTSQTTEYTGLSEWGIYKVDLPTTNFALVSNVVTGTPSNDVPGPLDTVVAFHQGTFAEGGNPYNHASIVAAAAAGYMYSDTATGTYSWGTLTSATDTAATGAPHSLNFVAAYTTYSWIPPTTTLTGCRTLCVAGGGGGGSDTGGGGGAGGYLEATDQILSGTQTIVVGGGGDGIRRNYNDSCYHGGNGGNSSISGTSQTSIGGGGGGCRHDTNASVHEATAGGSGGGASGTAGSVGGAGTAGQGYKGASSTTSHYCCGGGGASEPGKWGANATTQADGGNGKSSDILGTEYWWSGGGGGAEHSNPKGAGGKGGGGVGAWGAGTSLIGGGPDTNGVSPAETTPGTDGNWHQRGGNAGKHTGGGGGGGSHHSPGGGGHGGSGMVVIKFSKGVVDGPSQTYDTINKITVTDIPPDVTGKIYKASSAYTIYASTSKTNVTIKNTGKYVSLFTKANTTYLTNTIDVTETPISTGLDDSIEDSVPLVTTRISAIVAFHYGTFADSSDPHGDGDVNTAATAGHVYSDTPTGTYTWGTLTSGTVNPPSGMDYNASSGGHTPGNTTYKWIPPVAITGARMLLVGGGGGGGMDMGGGGGAGGFLAIASKDISASEQTVVVGRGGLGAPNASGTNILGQTQTANHTYHAPAYNGGNSSIGDETAYGGGRGGYTHNADARSIGGNGGSGGGVSGYNANPNNRQGGTGVSGQGNRGGNSNSTHYSSGGGGAGAAGVDATNQPHGGDGLSSDILGTEYWWSGGGGGAGYSTEGGNGGKGGGGGGAVGTKYGGTGGLTAGQNGGGGGTNSQSNTPGGDGGKHTGGGGGGGSHYQGNNKGGNGGSGIVIINFDVITITGGIAGSIPVTEAVVVDTTPSAVLDIAAIVTIDPILDLDLTTELPKTFKKYNKVVPTSIGKRFNRHDSKKKRIEKSIKTDTFSMELTANNVSSPTTLTVTVANSKFVINGDETPTLAFIRGETYTFVQTDASNSGHPLVLVTSEDGATLYESGWVNSVFTVPYDVPDTIYYKCTNHAGMGGAIHTTFGNLVTFGNFTLAANTQVSGEYTIAANYDGTTSNLYVDGDLITQTTPTISAGTKDFILGKEYDGYIKNFKFWNHVKDLIILPNYDVSFSVDDLTLTVNVTNIINARSSFTITLETTGGSILQSHLLVKGETSFSLTQTESSYTTFNYIIKINGTQTHAYEAVYISLPSIIISTAITDVPSTKITQFTSSSSITVSSAIGFSVSDWVMIHQTYYPAGNSNTTTVCPYEFKQIGQISGTTITFTESIAGTFSDGAQMIYTYRCNDFTLNSGITMTTSSWDQDTYKGGIIPIYADGTVTINGTIDVSGKGYQGIRSNYTGGFQAGNQGRGYDSARRGGGVGGMGGVGGPGNAGGGGGGGHLNNGNIGNSKGGSNSGNVSGGVAFGSTLGTYLTMGGSGGQGGFHDISGAFQRGGDGGGVVFVQGSTISGSGLINVNGVSGHDNVGSRSWQGGAGGGAGGMVLFKTTSGTASFTNVAINGGSGLNGTFGDGSAQGSQSGGSGSTGRFLNVAI